MMTKNEIIGLFCSMNSEKLYKLAAKVSFSKMLSSSRNITISFIGGNDAIMHEYGRLIAARMKDATGKEWLVWDTVHQPYSNTDMLLYKMSELSDQPTAALPLSIVDNLYRELSGLETARSYYESPPHQYTGHDHFFGLIAYLPESYSNIAIKIGGQMYTFREDVSRQAYNTNSIHVIGDGREFKATFEFGCTDNPHYYTLVPTTTKDPNLVPVFIYANVESPNMESHGHVYMVHHSGGGILRIGGMPIACGVDEGRGWAAALPKKPFPTDVDFDTDSPEDVYKKAFEHMMMPTRVREWVSNSGTIPERQGDWYLIAVATITEFAQRNGISKTAAKKLFAWQELVGPHTFDEEREGALDRNQHQAKVYRTESGKQLVHGANVYHRTRWGFATGEHEVLRLDKDLVYEAVRNDTLATMSSENRID